MTGTPAFVPTTLTQMDRWLVWRYETRGAKRTKVPYAAGGGAASTTDPFTWASFAVALAAAKKYDGVGFVFSAADDLMGLDLDHCRDAATGVIEPWALAVVERLDSYTEESPSGTGLHIFLFAKLEMAGRKGQRIEVYQQGRYFTITGKPLPGYDREPERRQAQVEAVVGEFFPAVVKARPVASLTPTGSDLEITERVRKPAAADALWRGDFSAYASQSEADLALCGRIAFFTGPDPPAVDRLFRQSGLMREKWDEVHGAQTYGARTIGLALAGKSEFYEWRAPVVAVVLPARAPPPAEETGEAAVTPVVRPWSSARELMAKQIPPLKWVVPGIIPEGLTLLAGRPKQGKSWGVYGLGVAVSTGGKAFGEKQVEAGDVLYLALEDGERRLKERLGVILRGAPIPERFDWAIQWPKLGGAGYLPTPENPDCRSQLLWWLDEHPEARLVAIDTLARVKPRSQKQGNAYEQDYSAMEPLQQLAIERRIALVLVTHTRKPLKGMGAGDVFDEIMDSTGITGGADTMLVLKKTRSEHELSLWVTGRDVDDQELLIKWDPDTSDWKLLGAAEATRLSALRKSILDSLNRSGEVMGYGEVAARIDRDTPDGRAAVKTTMYRMADSDLIISVGSGRFKRKPPAAGF
jgi:hypothetical protein